MSRTTESAPNSERSPSKVKGLLAGALATAALFGLQADTAAIHAPEPSRIPKTPETIADNRGIPGSIIVTGPVSPTDATTHGLWQLATLEHVVKNGLSHDQAADFSAALQQSNDPRVKTVVASAIVESVIGGLRKPAVMHQSEVDFLLAGSNDRQRTIGHQLYTYAVIRNTLRHIASSKREPEELGPEIDETGVVVTDNLRQAADLVDAASAFSKINDETSALAAARDVARSNNPEITSLAEDYVNSYRHTITPDARDQLLQRRDQLADWVGEAVARYEDQVSQLNDQNKAMQESAMQSLREQSQATISKIHDQLEPRQLGVLSGLERPHDTLDFSGATSDKKVERLFGRGSEVLYAQLAEVFVDGETSRLQFEASASLSDQTKSEMVDIYDRVAPIAEAAMQAGELVTIRFVVGEGTRSSSDSYMQGYYYPDAKSIHVILPGDDSLSRAALNQVLIHEITHALTEKAYRGVAVSDQEVQQMKAVCNAFSEEALSQFKEQLRISANILEHLVNNTRLTPDQAAVFTKLAEDIKKGQVRQVNTATQESESAGFRTCEAPSFNGVLLAAAGYEDNNEDGKAVVEEIKAKLHDDTAFKALRAAWMKAVDYNSLYALYVNESGRLTPVNPEAKKWFGHSQQEGESGAEIPSSIMSGLLGDQKTMRVLYQNLSSDNKEIVKKSYEVVGGILTERYPTLGSAIKKAIVDVTGG